MRHVNIYTYTSFRTPKRQNGVIGYVLECNGKTLSNFSILKNVTKNYAELNALTDALGRLRERVELDIYTESTYVYEGVTKWMNQWKASSWLTKKGEEVSNLTDWSFTYDFLKDYHYVVHLNEDHEYKKWLKSEVLSRIN